jgi:hypothetical protein
VGGTLLVISAAPLFTDDLWWHLGLGRAYASFGPWLAEDPLLYTATSAPAPAAWLSDLALYGVHQLAGFNGLRILHALLVAAILVLAWTLLRRAGHSRAVASLGTVLLACLAAYRLFQLRPHLVSMLAAFACYALLIEGGGAATRRRIALVCGLLAVWANMHAAFLLGPILLAAGLCGIAVARPFRDAEGRRRDTAHARALAAALVFGTLATLLNADGFGQHLAYFSAGFATPELSSVSDEWRRIDLFAWPLENLPPSLEVLLIVWLLVIATPLAGLHTLRRWQRGESGGPPPALLGVAGASLLAMLLAVRFVWLGLFPLLLIASALHAARAAGAVRLRRELAGAGLALLAAGGFFLFGDWPMLASAWPRSLAQFRQPYPSSKYSGHATGFLEDTGLSGHLFNEYIQGGYLGYRLAPRLRAYVNGSMNVPNDAMSAYAAIRQVRGVPDDESFEDVLERMQVDVFLGVRLPQTARANRPPIFTTAHLEAVPGWVQVFRNLGAAVYVRDNARNAENLDRVARWYASQGVPYDRKRGFEPARVIEADSHWAVRKALVPVNIDQIMAMRFGGSPSDRLSASAHLAALYATLGEYESAMELDTQILAARPAATTARRRLVWCLLRLDRPLEADAAAEALRRAPDDGLSHFVAKLARRNAKTERAEVRRQIALRLPVFLRAEASSMMARVVSAPPRPARKSLD